MRAILAKYLHVADNRQLNGLLVVWSLCALVCFFVPWAYAVVAISFATCLHFALLED